MIAVDTNLLVYAATEASRHHDRAVAALDELVGSRAWGIPSGVVFEFIAVSTDPRNSEGRDTLPEAIRAIDGWLADRASSFLPEPEDIWPRVRELAGPSGVRGPGVHDARIAATCIAHGVGEFWTADGDFLRFAELRVRNPLVG